MKLIQSLVFILLMCINIMLVEWYNEIYLLIIVLTGVTFILIYSLVIAVLEYNKNQSNNDIH